MTILIVSLGRDMHAHVAEYCLQKSGVPVSFMNTDELVCQATMSLSIDSQAHTWDYWNGVARVDFDEIETVWYRRVAQPRLPAGEIHPDDQEMARREVNEYSESLLQSIAPQARWVNPIDTTPRSSSKLAQLLQANRAGLLIPGTLVSNDPARIRHFLADPSPSIYKSMTQMGWLEDGKPFTLATSQVVPEDLPSDRMLQLVPGIYQRRIVKRSDVRTIFLGEQHTSIRMPVKDNPAGALDVRVTHLSRLKAELFELPDDVARACRAMMRAFGMEFACFDFVESMDGELAFLEINPAGQFLWMEGVVPDTKLLQKFLEFISAGQVLGPVAFLDVLERPDFRAWVRERNLRTSQGRTASAVA